LKAPTWPKPEARRWSLFGGEAVEGRLAARATQNSISREALERRMDELARLCADPRRTIRKKIELSRRPAKLRHGLGSLKFNLDSITCNAILVPGAFGVAWKGTRSFSDHVVTASIREVNEMDISAISAAITSGKALKDIIHSVASLAIDSAITDRINEAQHQVSNLLGALLETQAELFKLQDENQKLRGELKSKQDWEKAKANYQLQKTLGGAVVYGSISNTPLHYACPQCMEKHEIQILQDRRVMSGSFECPGCKSLYPVSPEAPVQEIQVHSEFDPRTS
jgi:hypothetical protein